MHCATLCYLMKDDQVLLGMKKRGFGAGLWNGYGGKVMDGETIEEATKREVAEEAGIMVDELVKVAEIDFFFPDIPEEKDWNQVVHVFTSKKFLGEPVETEEMKPQWFRNNKLPFDKFWDSDQYWFPQILGGKKVKGRIVFKGKGDLVSEYDIQEVQGF